jgi:hypothetical protein
LADNLKTLPRSGAVRFAALDVSGKGEDTVKSDDREMARLRNQTLAWLKAELALYTKQLDSGKPMDRAVVQATLRQWQQDGDMAGVRAGEALAALPEDERKAWAAVWSDVAALLVRVGSAR